MLHLSHARSHDPVVPSHYSRRTRSSRKSTSARSSRSLDVDVAKLMLDRDGFTFVDARSAKEYDRAHITKPPNVTMNVPLDVDQSNISTWAEACASRARSPAAKLLVADVDGARVDDMVIALERLGFTNVYAIEGGYANWIAKYTTSGRKQPPKGKWVSTGKEALKSGLDLDPNVSAAYEENWGKPPPKYVE